MPFKSKKTVTVVIANIDPVPEKLPESYTYNTICKIDSSHKMELPYDYFILHIPECQGQEIMLLIITK